MKPGFQRNPQSIGHGLRTVFAVKDLADLADAIGKVEMKFPAQETASDLFSRFQTAPIPNEFRKAQ